MTEEKIDAAGFVPRAVPLSVVVPLLEAGSLAEEPGLQGLWANLLANAADPRQLAGVLPSFPVILEELTASQARFLDEIYSGDLKLEIGKAFDLLYQSTLEAVYAEANSSGPPGEWTASDQEEFWIAVDQLTRSQLLAVHDVTVQVRDPGLGAPEYTSQRQYVPTHLGQSFVRACRSPVK
ncbi:MAG TPA: Abi-alpha family protein [Terriglobales bacterium]|nr:Abi-alpha family protein [Terriglobales bacterium]